MTDLYVYIFTANGWAPCGLLSMETDGRNSFARFGYGDTYLARPDSFPIDPAQLPFRTAGQSRTYETPAGFDVFNGIRDAAPDGWGRHLLESYAGGKALSEVDYIAGSSSDRVGALAFAPDINGPRRWLPSLGIDIPDGSIRGETASIADLVQDVSDIDIARTEGGVVPNEKLSRFLIRGSSLGGARPKATVSSDVARIGGNNTVPWIAKFSRHNDGYSVPRAEWLAMELARSCGITVPDTELIDIPGVEDAMRSVYLIRRFDRISDTDPIPFISALTILGAHESDYNRWGYSDIADALRTFGSPAFRRDMIELFDRMVLNAVVRNEDDHLRNHGFLWDGAGWRLSPLYDVTPAPATGTEVRLALGVGEDGRTATRDNLLSKAARFGLSADEADERITGIARSVRDNLPELREAAGVSKADWARLESCFALAHVLAEPSGPEFRP